LGTSISQPIYIGEHQSDNEVFKNVYPAIISGDLFKAVQKRIRERGDTLLAVAQHPHRKGSTYFLANVSSGRYWGSWLISLAFFSIESCLRKRQKQSGHPTTPSTTELTVDQKRQLVHNDPQLRLIPGGGNVLFSLMSGVIEAAVLRSRVALISGASAIALGIRPKSKLALWLANPTL
jgi:hypothetical protein